MTVTFFGHRDCPDTIRPLLVETIEDLIENHGADLFFVGHQGRFDAIVRNVLRDIAIVYPEIFYDVVLSRLPEPRDDVELGKRTILADGIEEVHPRYAVEYRNRWMLRELDAVVAYVTHGWGGAAKFVAQARRQGKLVIDLAEQTHLP